MRGPQLAANNATRARRGLQLNALISARLDAARRRPGKISHRCTIVAKIIASDTTFFYMTSIKTGKCTNGRANGTDRNGGKGHVPSEIWENRPIRERFKLRHAALRWRRSAAGISAQSRRGPPVFFSGAVEVVLCFAWSPPNSTHSERVRGQATGFRT